ncbi:phage integrase N-terminal SAM-like domain-containing protein [Pseudoalteromonas ardens]|uniref:phage integrase N-terminal SAM-like domain-containing protein n=1 Tax=Pseudoalteromonas ardens TaxID=3048490 RepID=UPI0024C38802|nr:phage integrase N-terminal SAM-like domain-containing protein [Pseudoalteromonas sp. R96]MDK1311118.1 phage integrase N-terminal SAM-like domain-containing protein [Pseudoalteromonas sp. R96]
MGNREIERFLNHLAVNRAVSAATQNQALCAIIFLYRFIIKRDIKGLNYSFSKRDVTLPTVLSAYGLTGLSVTSRCCLVCK